MRGIIFGDIYVQYKKFLSKGSDHEKVKVIVNCRTEYKFEYYQNRNPQDSNNLIKISSLKPETSMEIPFSNNSQHT